jgi:hypothetical protein
MTLFILTQAAEEWGEENHRELLRRQIRDNRAKPPRLGEGCDLSLHSRFFPKSEVIPRGFPCPLACLVGCV